MGERKISRRLFLGASAVTMSAEAIGLVSTEFEKDSRVLVGPSLEKFQALNKLDITFLNTEHTQDYWNQHKDALSQLVTGYDIVIPEYFPPEYATLTTNPSSIVSAYKSDNYVFTAFAEIFGKSRQNIWVFDPAYNMEFAKLRASTSIPEDIIEFFASYNLAKAGLKKIDDDDFDYFEEKQTPRRDLGQEAIAIVGALCFTLLGQVAEEGAQSVEYLVEQDVRHVLVAEQLVRLSKSSGVADNTSVLLVYPPSHIDGIKFYLTNPDERRKRLDLYMKAYAATFPTIFTRRYYPNGEYDPSHQEVSLLNEVRQ